MKLCVFLVMKRIEKTKLGDSFTSWSQADFDLKLGFMLCVQRDEDIELLFQFFFQRVHR